MRNILLIFLYLFSSVSTYCANPGDLDVTYNAAGNPPGTNVVTVPGASYIYITDNAIQSDQKCVAVGYAHGANTNIMLSRFNTDGTLDSASFNSADPTHPGIVVTGLPTSYANGVGLQANQSIVIAGYTTTQPTVPTSNSQNLIVARYNSLGVLDPSFGNNPFGGSYAGITTVNVGANSIATSLAIENGTNSIVVAGISVSNTVIAKFDSNGSLDTSFGGGTGFVVTTPADIGGVVGTLGATDIKINPIDNKIILAGYANTPSRQVFVARYNSDGTLDTTFNSAGDAPGFAFIAFGFNNFGASVVIQNDQKIVVGTTVPGGVGAVMALARFNADGTLDTTFGTDGIVTTASNGYNTYLPQIAIQSDQKIVAVGYTGDGVATVMLVLARFNTDGTLDSTFIDAGTSTPAGTVATRFNGSSSQLGKAVSIQEDQKIVVSGDRNSSVMTTNDILAARYLPGTFVTITSPTENQVLNNAQPTITGTMEVGNTIVQVSIDGGAFVSATTINSSAGTWSFVPSVLSDSAHTVQARTTDPDTVTALSSIINFIIDTSTFVTITSPTESEVINNAQPTITGTMEVGNTIVQVSIDGGELQNATVNSSAGTWTFTPASTLPQGSHTVQAFTTDPFGLTAQTVVINFIIDTSTFVTITSPTQSEIINNAQPTIIGTMQTGNTIVQVSIDGGALQNATVNSDAGTWTFTPASILSQGSHTVQAFTTDPFGLTAQTVVINFIIDTSTFVTITSPTQSEIINNAQPTITGTMQAGNTIVQVSIDGGSLQNATVNSSAGTWTFTPASILSQGSHTVQAFTTDPFGLTAQTVVINFIIDTSTFVTIISPVNGSTITTHTPLLTGTTASGNTVQIIIDGVSVGFATVNPVGAWSFQITSPLSNGIHSIQVIARNTIGETASVTISITIASSCVLPADQLTLALRNKYGQ